MRARRLSERGTILSLLSAGSELKLTKSGGLLRHI